MDFSFFTTDNKSGYKTTENWLSKNNIDLYNNIISYSKNINFNLNFKEKIWFYFNNLKERPKCKTCGEDVSFRNRFDKPYGDFCSLKCINENKNEMIKRQKLTFNNKYGVDFYPNHKDFIKKQKESKLLKYGNENYNNYEKIRETKLLKYGDKNFNNKQKTIETSVKKYGSTNPSKNNDIKEKIRLTNQRKYGTNSPTQSLVVKNKLKNTIYKKIKDKVNINEFINYDFSNKEYELKCVDCKNTYKIQMALYNERKTNGVNTCIYCNPIGIFSKSDAEISLSNTIKQHYSGEILLNNRKIINGELDIFIPEKNFAIEFNGLYWHSELYKEKNYHINKTTECENKNINLIHIFEDEWKYKKEIVESIIKNKLSLIKNKIFARKCKINEVDSKLSTTFLEKNHIQGGNCKNSVRYGLFYNGEIVSLMTFSKGRIAMGGKSNEWELTRFCNKINFNVIGGANKLFKHFLNEKSPKKIISYSDKRLFNGGLYEILGFKKIHSSKPNYWYIVGDVRKHRFNYRKDVLIRNGYNSNKTEREIMFDRKIYRIYDCGNVRWEYNY